MSGIVVDSSVVAKWVLREPDDDKAKIILDSAGEGTQLVVLDLAFAEVGSAIWKQHRLHRMTRDDAFAALQDLFGCPVTTEQSPPLVESGLKIAIKYDRAIYDALFVALVSKTGFQGVTADEPLYNSVHADYPAITLLRDWK